MTLTEFLLARIAEDEAVARVEVQRLAGAARRGGKRTARRRWAECEAKRRIVDTFEAREEQAHESNAIAAHATGLRIAMKILALVYADHPDYDEEWKP